MKKIDEIKNIMKTFKIKRYSVGDGTVVNAIVDTPSNMMNDLHKELIRLVPIKNPVLIRNYGGAIICNEWVELIRTSGYIQVYCGDFMLEAIPELPEGM